MDSLAEIVRLRAELQTERKWRADLQAFTIDQAVEIGKLREVLRKIEQATTEALARKVP